MKIFFKINRNGVSKVYYIAIDIGGTQIKSAVIDKQLNMFDYQQIPTPDNKSELITDKVYEIVTGYMKQYHLIQPVIGKALLMNKKAKLYTQGQPFRIIKVLILSDY